MVFTRQKSAGCSSGLSRPGWRCRRRLNVCCW